VDLETSRKTFDDVALDNIYGKVNISSSSKFGEVSHIQRSNSLL
jgi:hypothetical protein